MSKNESSLLSNYQENFRFLVEKLSGNASFQFTYKFIQHDDLVVEVAFNLSDREGEKAIDQIQFTLSSKEEAPLFEAYFTFIQGKLLEASERLGMREFDYFLRVHNSVPAFSAYTPFHLELISLAQKMREVAQRKETPAKTLTLIRQYTEREFFDLPTAEQFDLVEEVFALAHRSEDFECLEIGNDYIKLKSQNSTLYLAMREILFKELSLDCDAHKILFDDNSDTV